MVAAAGAGPSPIEYKQLSGQNIAGAIEFCLTPEASYAAQQIAYKMRAESGVKTAVESFHRHLPIKQLQCDILPAQPAAWAYKKGKKQVKLSKSAAMILEQHLRVDRKSLK